MPGFEEGLEEGLEGFEGVFDGVCEAAGEGENSFLDVLSEGMGSG